MDRDTQPVPLSFPHARPSELPKEIGSFKILSKIGEGGMGVVYLAQQEHPTRTVALKVIHAGALSTRTLRRFEYEGEMLARLQHPGIAQIYQSGTYATAQGVLPYFAMEFVEGARLDVHARDHALTVRARLELATRIADAIEHAHQKGVIHRDLKPGNILVTADGQPKIVDFGVGRLSDDDSRSTSMHTDSGALIGTLSYMSPEQAGGDPQAIDSRSDVYSLGVVLYELLAGKLPYELERAALHEAVRVIREEEPSKLSTHDRALRGDVETIVRKALEKDPTRRYPSAQALADDIRRHLADEPILARPPSAMYQLSKFARRNKILVAGVVAVVASLATGVTVSTRLWLQERAARRSAQTDEKHARAVADFLESLFKGIDPDVARGADTQLLQRILGEARGRLSSELAGQPEVEARLRRTLGGAYADLTLFDEAEVELNRAVELCSAHFGPDDRRTLDARHALANLLNRRGEVAAAEQAHRATLEEQEKRLGSTDRATLATKREIGDSLLRQGRHREAEQILRETLALQAEQFGADDSDVQRTRVALAQTLGFQSKFDEARTLLERVVRDAEARLGPDHPNTIVALASLGTAIEDVGEFGKAETMLRDALARSQRVYGADNQQTLSIVNNLSVCLSKAGKTAEAEAMLRDCLERRRRVFGKEHVESLNTLNSLAKSLWMHGKTEAASPLIVEALEATRRVLGEDHYETLRARSAAALLCAAQGRPREAAEHLEVVVAHERAVLQPEDPKLLLEEYNWAATLQNAGDDAASEPILSDLLRVIDDHPPLSQLEFVPAARNALAKTLDARGEHDRADELFQAALADRRNRHPEVSAELAYSLFDYGGALLVRGDFETAEPLLTELVQIQTKLLRADDWRLANCRQLAGRCLTGLGQYAEAEALLLPACEVLSKSTAATSGSLCGARAGILALYEAWDAAEPGQGIGDRAARWRTKFPAEN